MTPPGPVLCAVDLDQRAGAVLTTARDLALRLGTGLRVVHVRAPSIGTAVQGRVGVSTPVAVAVPPAVSEEDTREVLLGLGVTEDELALTVGLPEVGVLDAVGREQPALVVAGTRGAGAVRAAVAGSVSRALTRDPRCPAVVVPRGAPGGVRRDLVLCAVSPRDDEAHAAMTLAVRLARRGGGPLVLAHVAEVAGGRSFAALGVASAAEAKRRALARLRQVAPWAGDEAAVVLEPCIGDPATALSRAAGACRAGLVVVSSRGLGALQEGLLGSVSRRLASDAPCPVVIARPS